MPARPHQHVALRVGNDLGGIERLADGLDPFAAIARDFGLRSLELLGRRHPLLLQVRHAPGINRLGDEGDGQAQFGGVDDGPFAGALLAGGVQDLVHQRLAVGVLVGQDVGRDFDEVGIQLRFVPIGEALLHFSRAHAQTLLEQVVGLADQLHVPVLDAVMDHFDIVAGPVLAHPIAARRPILHLGRDGLENVLHVRPGLLRAAGHDGGAVARPLLAARNARADEQQPLALKILDAPVGVLEERVASVNYNVARFQPRQDFLDQLVHRRAGLDHQHDPARPFEQRRQFGQRMRADDPRPFGFAAQELIHAGGRAVENGHREPVVVHIEHQVLAHDGQSDQSDISLSFHTMQSNDAPTYKTRRFWQLENPASAAMRP